VNRLDRRGFLKVAGVAGGGLVLGFGLSGCGEKAPWPNLESGVLQPNAFIQVRADGAVVLTLSKIEMGQGAATGFATLVAEELGMDPLAIEFGFAEPHKDYGDPEFQLMITGGSSSLKGAWQPLREAAATVREMLLQAAAASWNVAPGECLAEGGRIRLRDGSRDAGFGEFAVAAQALPVPASVTLKPASEWTRIGKHDARVDARAKVDGSARFAIDVQLPGMLTAVLLRCPHQGGSLQGFDAARAVVAPGVRQIVACAGGVAVIADGYWSARSAAQLVEVQWDKGPLASLDSAGIAREQSRRLDHETGKVVREEGKRSATAPARQLKAEYHVPYLAHATMEPMNAVASITGDRAEIWAGNQAPDVLQGLVARVLGIPPANVTVHTTYLGGGFGRRLMVDFCLEAVLVAQAAGAPVKLIWSREDDTQHDYYRPSALARMTADIGPDGALLSVEGRLVAPSIYALMMKDVAPAMMPQWMPAGIMKPVAALVRGNDPTLDEGVSGLPYEVPYLRVEALEYDPGIRVGVWRSVGHSQNAFFAESFIDELAHDLGEDPVAFRLKRLAAGSRHARVLQAAADAASWGKAGPGRVQGVALHESFNSVVAEVVELSVTDGKARIERVVCAVDCGTVVNPDVVRMQVESGVVFALSAALHGEITVREGAVQQDNFDSYPLLRMNECPVIEVVLLSSDAAPTGIGEPPTPPLAPALGNALFAATGARQRKLPLSLG
jgi:CO/xanthine dehydrogenase Mo-binding subunit